VTAEIVGLLASLALLTMAGDQFVIGIARVAAAFDVRLTVVGAVIGGLGTSLPELIVSGVATARGDTPIAVGNLVGSIIANVCLGLALPALVAPVGVDSRALRREAPLSVASVLVFAVLVHAGLGRVEAIVATVALVAALVGLLVIARRVRGPDELALEVEDFFEPRTHRAVGRETARGLLSMAVMLAGAELLVRSASGLSERAGLGQGFVGLTVVAIGTSAPLIASSIQAARRGDHDLVVGNMLGGNLFIGLAGGAIVGFMAGRSAATIGVGPLVLMAAVTTASWGFMGRGSRVTRWEAAILLVAYAGALPFVSG